MKKFSPKDELKSQKGQVLIESVVAMSLIVIGLLGILTLLSNSIAFNRNAANKLTATYLAAEGIEVMKSIADENYTQRKPWGAVLSNGNYEATYDSSNSSLISVTSFSSNPLIFHSGTGIYDYISGSGSVSTIFKRTIKIVNSTDNKEITINSIVQWADKNEAKEVNLEDHFFNWR
ncbi:MAG: hypothetical protein AAB572_00940 [Patescibacteria group bacterium]